MKKWLPIILLLTLTSVACSTQTTNQPQNSGTAPAATTQADNQGDPRAPRNAATEAMGYCIQCVDRTYDQQNVDKSKLDTLKKSFDNTMSAISDMATTKEQKSQAVRDSLEIAQKVIPEIPSLTGLDSSLEEVLKAIDTLPETEIQAHLQPTQEQAPVTQSTPPQGQAPTAANQPPAQGETPASPTANSK